MDGGAGPEVPGLIARSDPLAAGVSEGLLQSAQLFEQAQNRAGIVPEGADRGMQPITRRTWQLRQPAPAALAIRSLAASLKIHEITAQVLLLRGISGDEDGKTFLAARLASLPDPDLLPGMQPACERLVTALAGNERIAVHGDYDVDGMTGCALLVETLRELGAQVEYHIPLRLKDGYGLSADALRRAHESGCRLVVSVDCGVSAREEADLARSLGLDLIITDHHQPPVQLPDCLALINPHLPESRFPWPDLSGVGVAFFLLAGLRRTLRDAGYFSNRKTEPDLRSGLDLVALGTIADLVPLHGVNRILVRSGLQRLEGDRRPGLTALKKVSNVSKLTSGSVGFRLAPRLNAAGRLEDAALGVKLLLSRDREDCAALAGLLDGFNHERQQLEEQTLREAIALLDQEDPERCSIVLASDGWHPGVIGIVASRLVERYHRPTVLIALEGKQGKGSARSIKGFHLYQSLQSCAATLDGFGGHAMAAGLTIAADAVEDLRRTFEKTVRNALNQEPLPPLREHDGEVALTIWTRQLLKELDGLQPCGIGNPQALFVSRNCTVQSARVVGEKHLKFTAEQNGCRLECIAFGQADRLDELTIPVDLLYRPEINQWRGQESVQLVVSDFRLGSSGTTD